jgi:hypothetical protein
MFFSLIIGRPQVVRRYAMETNHALPNNPLSTLSPEETAMSNKKKTALIKKLTNRHIENAFDDLGILHRRDEDDSVYTFIPSGTADSGLSCWFIADGNILQFTCSINPSLPQDKWPSILMLCNTFYKESRFGRAVLYSQEDNNEANLRFEAAIDCSGGISTAFLQTFIVSHIATACTFYSMVQDEMNNSQDNITDEEATSYLQTVASA